MFGVVRLGRGAVDIAQIGSHEPQALALDTGNDFADRPLSTASGLHITKVRFIGRAR